MEIKRNKVCLKIGGEAGEGVATIGAMFSKCLKMCGLYVVSTNDFPSLIRGGHNTHTVRGDEDPIYSQTDTIDVLVALNKETVLRHIGELGDGGAILYDEQRAKFAEGEIMRKDVELIPVPMMKFALEAGNAMFFNTVALGACLGVLSIDFAILEKILRRTFGRKGEEIVQKNILAARKGYEHAHSLNGNLRIKISIVRPDNKIFMTGNDALCAGAVKAGVKFVAEYPMSPSSSILHFMAANENKHSIVVKHTEDEISAANMITGAAVAGARSMTATSGGGFSLMVEAMGLAGMCEAPIVIVDCQRPGPSTCLPTHSEQGDLRFCLHASQGDFPRVVIAPGDVTEAFYETFHAFNVAELVQTPVIILMDKYLSESGEAVEKFDTSSLKVDRGLLQSDEQMEKAQGFKRYAVTESGISPRCIPGQKNGIHVATSYEHDETGWTSEDAANRVAQVDKRARKLDAIPRSQIKPKIYGPEDSSVLVVSWGSTKMPVREAANQLALEGIMVRHMHLVYLSPFPDKEVEAELKNAKKATVIEMNSTGQLRGLIREKTGVQIQNALLKYDGRPFDPIHIKAHIRELMFRGNRR
jgi:2-oxoglutarate ferredoxin oxidoreductase subunit alpha